MKNGRLAARLSAFGSVWLALSTAHASTGTCDVSPGDSGMSELACIGAIAKLGPQVIVDDIFTDSNGKTGDQLLYGQLVDPYASIGDGCSFANSICNGDLTTNQGSPAVICINSQKDFATVAPYVNALDWKYGNAVRLHDVHGALGADADCPDFGNSVTDGNKEGYKPWEGFVFDLGGPSNKVVLFPVNDHGPQPCESVEYTVYLTDNPASRDLIDDPTTTGADPSKWNRAHLSKLFLEGWKKVRPGADVTFPDPNNMAQNLTYTIEGDSFTSVWSLPCGINFRYVGVIAGNDGKDLPECNFDSFDAELDAVAGLTEGGAGVCPDADNDKFVDCNCPTAPPVCDCNDADPSVHPGAPEKCDDPDKNCDGKPGGCDPTLTCFQSICIPDCGQGENPFCPPGSSCQNTAQGKLCVPVDCSVGGCPAGSVCKNKVCVPACDSVVCPGSQICEDGKCIDPCQGVQCPSPQVCEGGKCLPPCTCFANDIGCAALPGTVCDRMGTGLCEAPTCVGIMCMNSDVCDPMTGMCEGFCNMMVMCPQGEKCVDPDGCVPLCTGVKCPMGFECDQTSGSCVDVACKNVQCIPPAVCTMGQCKDPSSGSGGAGGTGSGAGGAGGAMTNASASSTGGTGQNNLIETTGCGCRIQGEDADERSLAALASALLGVTLVLRRRKR